MNGGMTMISRAFFILIGLIVIIYIYNKVKNNKLEEKESFFWMTGAVLILVLSIFPKILDIISKILNIYYPPALLFLVAIIFILYLILRLTISVTLLKKQCKELAQRNALLEKQLYNKEKDIIK